MPETTRSKLQKVTGLIRNGLVRLGLVGVLALATIGADAARATANADTIVIRSGGFGFAVGTGGYRSGFYFGPGFYGPPYRPYGAPYYYHPYDRRAYPYRSRVYVNPRVRPAPPLVLSQPQRVPYTKTGLAPFTPEWVAYCARKFKSFNPRTGTYLAYSGRYRFCR